MYHPIMESDNNKDSAPQEGAPVMAKKHNKKVMFSEQSRSAVKMMSAESDDQYMYHPIALSENINDNAPDSFVQTEVTVLWRK